jgi:hypothetical protein
MKNTIKLMWFIAIIAAIGFTMAACEPAPKDPDLPGSLTITVTGGGSAQVNKELTAVYDGAEDVSFAWTRGSSKAGDGATITPETAGTYTVTASASGFQDKSETIAVTARLTLTGTPTVTGGNSDKGYAFKDDVLTVSTAGMNGTETYSYQWKYGAGNDAVDIEEATNATYTVLETDIGKTITVSVTCFDYTGTRTSDPVEAMSGHPALNWTEATGHPFTNNMNDILAIAWNGSTFVVAGRYKMATSPDGITWTEVTDEVIKDFDIQDIVWNGDMFLAVGNRSNEAKVATSLDGTTWTAGRTGSGSLASVFGMYGVSAVAWGGGKFVAVGRAETAWSSDGDTWTAPTSGKPYGRDIYCVAWGGSGFVSGMTGGYLYYSTDGDYWSSGQSGTAAFNGITYGNNMFIAVGGTRMARSSNGSTWYAVTNTTFNAGSNIYNIAWGGETGKEMFVAVGSGGRMATSSNGTAWTAIPAKVTNFGGTIRAIAWGGDKFVAVGSTSGDQKGKIIYSSYPAEE